MAKKKKEKKAEVQKAEEKSESFDRNTKFMIGGFIALLVILIALFSIKNFYTPAAKEEESYTYNGYTFTKSSGLWKTDVLMQGANILFEIPLHYGPREVESIYFTGNKERFNYFMARYGYDNITKQGAIFVTFDPRETNLSYIALAAGELSINLAQGLGIEPVAACLLNITKACSNRPIIDCDNTRAPVIYLKVANESKVDIDANCIIVEGSGEGLLQSTDRLILSLYGIMQIDKNQSSIFLYASKKDMSIDVDVGIYDQRADCAWTSGALSVDVLDADGNVLANRKLSLIDDDQFLDYCVTKKPINIVLSAEDYAKAKYVNGSFVTNRGRLLPADELAEIKEGNAKKR